jgi:hypothetical protein
MLQLQSKNFATITNKLEANVKGEVLSRPKIDVSIGKNAFKTTNLRAIRDYEVITNAKFKIRVKDLLNFQSIVTIPTMLYWVVMVFANNFNLVNASYGGSLLHIVKLLTSP